MSRHSSKHTPQHRKCRSSHCHLPRHRPDSEGKDHPHCPGGRQHTCGQPNREPNFIEQLYTLSPADTPLFSVVMPPTLADGESVKVTWSTAAERADLAANVAQHTDDLHQADYDRLHRDRAISLRSWMENTPFPDPPHVTILDDIPGVDACIAAGRHLPGCIFTTDDEGTSPPSHPFCGFCGVYGHSTDAAPWKHLDSNRSPRGSDLKDTRLARGHRP